MTSNTISDSLATTAQQGFISPRLKPQLPFIMKMNFKTDDSQISNLKQINYPSSFRISTLSYMANVSLIQGIKKEK
jgi:hypothetical protein